LPLAPVLVARATFVVDEGGWIEWGADLEPRELPDEFVLRQLADADLDDDAAVVPLLEQYGATPWPYYNRVIVPGDRHHLLAPPPTRITGVWWEGRDDGRIEDARWWLKTARALAHFWAFVSGVDGDPLSAWSDEGFHTFGGAEWGEHVDWAAWMMFAAALNVGLLPFRARVELPVPGSELVQGAPVVSLYQAACHQIFNLAVEEQTARRCENASCGRVFVHQLGGAKFGQHRSKGVRFCSTDCRRAETQRQYRRRRKAAGKEQP
jgi:hypothetical protein